MSRAKGNAAKYWVADYLRRWWPSISPVPNGLPGADFIDTLGVKIELKTGKQWRADFIRQAVSYRTDDDVPLLIWLQERQGKESVGRAAAILALPLEEMMTVLEDSGWAPAPARLIAMGDQ